MNEFKTVSGIVLQQLKEGIELNGKNCPISGDKGKRVFRITIGSHAMPKYWRKVKEDDYYFCPNKQCPVIYFSKKNTHIFVQEELRTPVMHKMEIGTENRPVCYCMQVLEEEIIEEMVVRHCCDSLIDIQNFTGANKGKDCKITNPTGRCCGKPLKELIEWIQEHKRDDVKPPVLEEAISCCKSIEENASIELELP